MAKNERDLIINQTKAMFDENLHFNDAFIHPDHKVKPPTVFYSPSSVTVYGTGGHKEEVSVDNVGGKAGITNGK